mmetsp:Transcript_18798/g.25878  ORF Transcript_18798/g.25878 Transcript_18798/m.25878 type:complete len:287 (-) Transcript_18798:216-1076(-)
MGTLLSGDLKPTAVEKTKNTSSKAKKKNRRDSNETNGSSIQESPVIVSEAYQPGPSSSSDLIDFVRLFQPYAEKSKDATALRKKGFLSADMNGNGECSLAELENYIMTTIMGSKIEKDRKKNLFKAFRPSYIRAYNAAKSIKSNDGTVLSGAKNATEDDFVSFGEFRVFNAYLCIYAGMFDAFSRIDGMGEGRNEGDDLRIDLDEWMGCYKQVKDHGFVGLANVSNDDEAKATFQVIDDNGGGKLHLVEWCEFIKKAEIEAKTKMGTLLSGVSDPCEVEKSQEGST